MGPGVYSRAELPPGDSLSGIDGRSGGGEAGLRISWTARGARKALSPADQDPHTASTLAATKTGDMRR
jgi:hypothetical protein